MVFIECYGLEMFGAAGLEGLGLKGFSLGKDDEASGVEPQSLFA